MGTEPRRWCVYDHCCQFEPQTFNHVYCSSHKCKRRAENSRKRLTAPVEGGEELWKIQEQRKLGRLEVAKAKNEWLLNSSKIVFFDLETFDLAADFGLVMVGCVKERGGPTQTFSARGDAEERACLLGIRDAVEAADFTCTYYGTGFDLPYINTRLLINGERPIERIRHVDLYYTARFKLKLNRNRLDNVEDAFFGDVDAKLKTRIRPGIWRRALQGSADDLAYIADHCERDVELLEKVFEKLRGFVNLSATRWRSYGGSY